MRCSLPPWGGVACAVAVGVVSACGGRGPTDWAPPATLPSPPPVTMAVTDGDGTPLAAAVLVDGVAQNPTAPGTFSVRPDRPAEIVLAGYVTRQTRTQTGAFSLFDLRRLGGAQDYLQGMVYTPYSPGNLLSRPRAGQVFAVSLSSEFEADWGVDHALDEALAALNVFAAGRVSFVRAAADSGDVRLLGDGSDPALEDQNAAAVTYLSFQGNVIVSAKVVFRSKQAARSTPLQVHELGHVLGLGHSADPREIMYSGPIPDTRDFSPRLSYVHAMMFQRKTGTAYPDDDRQAVGRLARSTGVVVD